MNTFAIIILVALVLEFALKLAGNLLNLKALNLELSPSLQGIYKSEDYHKSQEYIRATTRFGLVGSSFTLFLLLAFWFSGGFNWQHLPEPVALRATERLSCSNCRRSFDRTPPKHWQ